MKASDYETQPIKRCEACKGTGYDKPEHWCRKCDGTGKAMAKATDSSKRARMHRALDAVLDARVK